MTIDGVALGCLILAALVILAAQTYVVCVAIKAIGAVTHTLSQCNVTLRVIPDVPATRELTEQEKQEIEKYNEEQGKVIDAARALQNLFLDADE